MNDFSYMKTLSRIRVSCYDNEEDDFLCMELFEEGDLVSNNTRPEIIIGLIYKSYFSPSTKLSRMWRRYKVYWVKSAYPYVEEEWYDNYDLCHFKKISK